jgi:hypothetical protein
VAARVKRRLVLGLVAARLGLSGGYFKVRR